MKTIVCIGAGPAGLTAALTLAKSRHDVLILEADPKYVGGISRTITQDEFCFDIGGHRFFSKSAEVITLWKEILGDDLLTCCRKSRIYYGGKFYAYPLDLFQTLNNLGMVESGLCALSYLRARLTPHRQPVTFEQWVTNQFGARLFYTFFKTYTEKIWGMPCNKISADWAAQRIKGLSLATAAKNGLFKAMGWRNKDSGIKTLIEEFLYPRKGPGMMWEAMAHQVMQLGGQIEMGCTVKSLTYDTVAKQWTVTYNNCQTNARHIMTTPHVISSMPLQELVSAIEKAPEEVRHAASNLRYRDFITVALILNDRNIFDDNWIYIHTPGVKVGRIQNFKAWSHEMVPNSALVCYGMEYFCFEHDELWNSSDETLIALATRELASIGLAQPQDVITGYVVRQPKAYPVYDHDYRHHIGVIREWLDRCCPNLQVVGRNGMHKYNNQDHSMMTGMLAARNIIDQHIRYDLWAINQDAEYHEGQSSVSGERQVPIHI